MSTRIDYRMHSAEHILNQTMVRLYDCGRCFNAHIGKKKSKLDYHFDHALTHDEVTEIQLRVKDVIAANMPVTESHILRSEVDRLYNIEKVPDDAGDTIRIMMLAPA